VSLPAFIERLRGASGADPEAYVDFAAAGMPLVRLAEWFDRLFPGQILIPASKARAQVTTETLSHIKLADLVERIGLVPASKPLVGRPLVNDE
jgi:hypothetical protein